MNKLIKRKLRTLFNLIYNKPIGVIYMLHRVHQFETGKLSLNENMKVSPEFLERFIVDRIGKYEFISLDKAIDVIQKKIHLSKPFIVFTFDDGYADNYLQAFPIFQKHNIPFTIYVSTGFVDKLSLLWWYQLEDIIMQNNSVKLSNGMSFSCNTISEKEASFLAIRKIILELPASNFDNEVRELLYNYALNFDKYTDELILTWNQILEMSQSPLCTIGAHTITHRRLSELSHTDLIEEINQSKVIIEEKIKKNVAHFAYPFGTNFEVNFEVVDAVKAGYDSAIYANGGVIRKLDKDLYSLPRTMLVEKI